MNEYIIVKVHGVHLVGLQADLRQGSHLPRFQVQRCLSIYYGFLYSGLRVRVIFKRLWTFSQAVPAGPGSGSRLLFKFGKKKFPIN